MTPIIENIADANAHIHELTKKLEAKDAELKALQTKKQSEEKEKQEKADLKSIVYGIIDERKLASSEDVESLTERVVSTEKQLALLRPQSDPVKQVATFPDTGDLNGRTLDELYAIQRELPTAQERQAFYDQYIYPKQKEDIDAIINR